MGPIGDTPGAGARPGTKGRAAASVGDVRVRERDQGALRCPYCRDAIGGDVAPCAGCGVRLHPSCAAEARRCPTIGCATELAPDRAAPRPVEAPAGEARRRGGPPGGVWALLALGLVALLLLSWLASARHFPERVLPGLYLAAALALFGAQLVRVLRRRRFEGARLHLRPHPARAGQPLELTLTVPPALRQLAFADPALVLRAELRHVRRSLPRGVDREQARGEQAVGHVAWRAVALADARNLRQGQVTFTFVPPAPRRGWEYGWELGAVCEVPGPDFVEAWDVPFEDVPGG